MKDEHSKTLWPRRALMVAAMGAALPAVAQTPPWPNRPIKMIIPGAAGQGSDLFGRLIGNALSKALGQPVVIDNKVGASGIVGTDAAAKSPGDGYTMLFSNASFTVMLKALGQKTPYDLQRDLIPVVQIGSGGSTWSAVRMCPPKICRSSSRCSKDSPTNSSTVHSATAPQVTC